MSDGNDKDLKAFINRELLPRIKALNAEREQKAWVFKIAALGSTIAVVITLGLAGVLFEIDEVLSVEFAASLAVVVLFGIGLHGVFHLVFVRGATQRYVEDVVAPLVDHVRPGVEFNAREGIEVREFEQSKIAQLPLERFESRGVFSVRTDGAMLRFGEVDASCRVKKEGERFGIRRTCFVARGLFFVAHLDESVRGTTVITPTLRRFVNADKLPRVRAPGADKNPPVRPAEDWPTVSWVQQNHDEPVAPVTVPDPEFHAHFDVWSTDIAQARQMLRPTVLECLKKVHTVWHSDAHRTAMTRTSGQGYFVLVLRDDRVFLSRAMPRKLVEIRAFEPGDQAELLLQYARDIRLATKLIDTLI